MNWNITKMQLNKTKTLINIELYPKNDILKFFLLSINLLDYAAFLKSVNNLKNYNTHATSLRFYKNLDWEELDELLEIGGIKEGEVAIYYEVCGETILEESIFKELIIDYSQELLDVYSNDSSLPDSWGNEMTDEITKLKNSSRLAKSPDFEARTKQNNQVKKDN